MRIISGRLRGRQFATPAGEHTRPTADRAKVALFNILGDVVVDARVLDGFAGSGALSFECLSRGARHCLLFERDRNTARLLQQNAEALGVASLVDIHESDFLGAADRLSGQEPFSLAFLDPPYDSGLLLPAINLIAQGNLLSEHGLLVAEHDKRTTLPVQVENLVRSDSRTYGVASFTFYRKQGSDEDLGIPGQF